MKTSHFPSLVGAALAAVLLTSGVGQAQQNNVEVPEGVEILTRGPVHEAYADPGDRHPRPEEVVPREPPAPIEELPPEQRPEGEDVMWVPGYWDWDVEREDFIWVSGFWRIPPPGMQWVPGHWVSLEDGWQWSPGFWLEIEQTEVQYLPPPPEPIEAAPATPAPDQTSIYVPGCWVYHETRYVWRPGYWIGYQPGWVWVPARYCWTPSGYVFVEGHWDHDLDGRGMLFAPVYVHREVLVRERFVYRPSFVVRADFLLTSLFVNRHAGCYYFGDYFDPRYEQRGFVAWFNYRSGRGRYNPLYAYYRHHHGRDRDWDRNLQQLYVARRQGEAPRPPRTFAQQQQVIQNITVNQNVTNVQNLVAVASITNVTRFDKRIRLEKVSQDRMTEIRQRTQQLQQASQRRREVESKFAAQTPRGRGVEQPRTVKLDLPRVGAAARPGKGDRADKAPPPRPELPRAVERPQRGGVGRHGRRRTGPAGRRSRGRARSGR